MARLGKEELPDMGSEGENVTRRRERLGMDKVELASAAGIHRNTLSAIEAGSSGQRAKLVKVLKALDDLEAEAGIDAPKPWDSSQPDRRAEPPRTRVVRLRHGDVEVVVEDTGQSDDELVVLALRLLRGARGEED